MQRNRVMSVKLTKPRCIYTISNQTVTRVSRRESVVYHPTYLMITTKLLSRDRSTMKQKRRRGNEPNHQLSRKLGLKLALL